MTQTRNDEERLSPQDERFIRRLAEGFAPPPRSETQQQSFRRNLEERLQGRRRATFGWPSLVATATLAVVALVLLRTPPEPAQEPSTSGTIVAVETFEASPTGFMPEEILVGTAGDGSASEALPADYAAIGDVLLGS